MDNLKKTVFIIGDSYNSCYAAEEKLSRDRVVCHHYTELPTLNKQAIETFTSALDDYYEGIDIVSTEQFNDDMSLFLETRLLLVEREPVGTGYDLYRVYREPIIRGAAPTHTLFVNKSKEPTSVMLKRSGDVGFPVTDHSYVKDIDFDNGLLYSTSIVKYLQTLLEKNPIDASEWGKDIRNSRFNSQYIQSLLTYVDVDLQADHLQPVLQNPEEAMKYLHTTPYRLVTASNGKVHGPADDSVEAWFNFAKLCKTLIECSDYIYAIRAYITHKEE